MLVWIKGPEAEMEERLTGPTLVFVNTTDNEPLVEPTGWEGKLRILAESVKPALKMVSCNGAECEENVEIPVIVTRKLPPGVENWLAMVMIELAPLAPGTTLSGEKLQVALAGSPEQESDTGFGKLPPSAFTETGICMEEPATKPGKVVDGEIEKSRPVPPRETE